MSIEKIVEKIEEIKNKKTDVDAELGSVLSSAEQELDAKSFKQLLKDPREGTSRHKQRSILNSMKVYMVRRLTLLKKSELKNTIPFLMLKTRKQKMNCYHLLAITM